MAHSRRTFSECNGEPVTLIPTKILLTAKSVTLDDVAAQFIFTMRDLRRFYPPDREVLRGINLSFYPGAKIGVIGANGSGKSSLLRIMAGLDDGFTGEARLTPGFSVGFLSQEPRLDETKDVVGNVADGVAEQRDLLIRFNEVCAAFGDPDADFEKLLSEQSELQSKIDAANAWDLERTLDIAMDALRLPPPDASVADFVRRREASGRPLSAPAIQAGPVVARRTDEPLRRRIGGLARAHSPGLQRHRRRRNARPLLP